MLKATTAQSKTSLAFCVTTVALNVVSTVIVTESTVVNAHLTAFAMTVVLVCIIIMSRALRGSFVVLNDMTCMF